MGQPSRWVWGVLLCLTISTTPGSSADSVDPATFDTTTIALAIEITNQVFNASLQNHQSEYSKWMDAEVKMLLDGVYKCNDCATKLTYGGVECITYSGGENRDDRDWVPGWGIALLVLAAAILFLLIIIFILLCVHYCRKRPSEDPMGKNPDPYYEQNKMPPQETVPVLYPSLPVTAPSSPMQAQMVVGDTPKKNRTGFYAVNP
ncbi:unnamed protein product [Gadus morhua 'NCC']